MKFWKIFAATLLAVVVGFGIRFFMLTSIGLSLLDSLEPQKSIVPNNSILRIDLNQNIIDAPLCSSFGALNPTTMSIEEPITLLEAIATIEAAAMDSRIKGICINIDGTGTISAANIEELRSAIERFKKSGKFVVAYDDNYTQGEYLLASVADVILLQPEGSLSWRGVGMGLTFYRGLLDKIDAKVEVFRPSSCKYKSGVEPYILNKMSKENREQMLSLTDSMWDVICQMVSQSRNIPISALKRYASELDIVLAEDAVKYGLVDELAYEDRLAEIYKSYGVEPTDDGIYNTVSLGEYIMERTLTPMRVSVDDRTALSLNSKDLVAILYADGQIVDGNIYMDDYVYGTRLAHELRACRLDPMTKAVVLRVNSPGGSALASDVVWREMMLLQQEKTLVVSMGSMAASGGYYISVPADIILADRLTLTGSIGVYGVMFNLEDTFKKHLGITFDSVATSDSADALGIFHSLTAKERKAIGRSVDKIYDTFISHVAEGRNMSEESVRKVAEGRVWSGVEAKEVGLIDDFGGLNEAISMAMELAGIDMSTGMIYEYVAPLTPFEEWLNSMGMLYANMSGIEFSLYHRELTNILREAPMVITEQGMQAILPGELKLNM